MFYLWGFLIKKILKVCYIKYKLYFVYLVMIVIICYINLLFVVDRRSIFYKKRKKSIDRIERYFFYNFSKYFIENM